MSLSSSIFTARYLLLLLLLLLFFLHCLVFLCSLFCFFLRLPTTAYDFHFYCGLFNLACKKLDRCLMQLTGRYATTKFIRIKSREVDFDEEVYPTVLVYRAGDVIANLVMITYELSEGYDDIELEELFTKYVSFVFVCSA